MIRVSDLRWNTGTPKPCSIAPVRHRRTGEEGTVYLNRSGRYDLIIEPHEDRDRYDLDERELLLLLADYAPVDPSVTPAKDTTP